MRIIVAITVFYLLGLVLLIWFERWLVFPAPGANLGNWSPDLEYREIEFESTDKTHLVGWLFEHPEPQHVLIYFHGNGENIAFNAKNMDRFRDQFEATVFIVDYRGYGKSHGKPEQEGVLADGLATFDFLAKELEVAPEEIVIVGRSLGGSVGCHVASERSCRALVLDSTFDSIANVAAGKFPIYPVRYLMHNKFPSAQWAADIDCPVMQFHRRYDRVVPFEHGRKLHEAIGSNDKTFVEVETGGHNSAPDEAFFEPTRKFLDALK